VEFLIGLLAGVVGMGLLEVIGIPHAPCAHCVLRR
jgi:hypothetical protein